MQCAHEARDMCTTEDLNHTGKTDISDFRTLVSDAAGDCDSVEDLALRGIHIYYGRQGVCAVQGIYGNTTSTERLPGEQRGRVNPKLCSKNTTIVLPNTDYFTGILAFRRNANHITSFGMVTKQNQKYGPYPATSLEGSEAVADSENSTYEDENDSFSVPDGYMVHSLSVQTNEDNYLTHISACKVRAPEAARTPASALNAQPGFVPLSTPALNSESDLAPEPQALAPVSNPEPESAPTPTPDSNVAPVSNKGQEMAPAPQVAEPMQTISPTSISTVTLYTTPTRTVMLLTSDTATPTTSNAQATTSTTPDTIDVLKIVVAALGGFLVGAILVLAFVHRKRIVKKFSGRKQQHKSTHPDEFSPSTTINVPLTDTKSTPCCQHTDQQPLVASPHVTPQTPIRDSLAAQEMAFGECKTPLTSVTTGITTHLSESDNDSLYSSVRSLAGGSKSRVGPSTAPTQVQEAQQPQQDREDLYAVPETNGPTPFMGDSMDGFEGEIEKPYVNFPEALYATVNMDTPRVQPITPDNGKVSTLGPCEPINDAPYISGYASPLAIGGEMSLVTNSNNRSPSFSGGGIANAYSQRSLPKTPCGSRSEMTP